MRALPLPAAFSLAAILILLPIPAVAAGTADVLPKPTERQQEVIDVLAKLDALSLPTRQQFLAGSMSFAVYHELGHFLIDEYDIATLSGREEDMADAYATFELASYTAREQMQAPVRLWLYYAFLKGTKPVEWWDEHSLDHQRAFQIACFLSGRWPEHYSGLPEAFGASPRRAAQCPGASHRTQTAWVETLRAQGAAVIDRQKVVVTYLPAPEELSEAHKWLSASGLLESVATEIQRYKMPEWRIDRKARLERDLAEGRLKSASFDDTRQYVEVIAGRCGEANAFYSPPKDAPGLFGIQPQPNSKPQRPRITVCYELVDRIRMMAEGAGLPEGN